MRRASLKIYEFGDFRVDADEKTLWRDNSPVEVTPKAFEILLVLVENAGRVVPKDEIFARVWADSFVEEANLSHHIFRLRKALGEDQGLKFIETVPKRGYRFVAEVTETNDDSPEKLTATAPDSSNSQSETTNQPPTSAAQTGNGQTFDVPSSAESAIKKIKRRKKGLALALTALGLMLAAAIFLWYKFADRNTSAGSEGKMRMTRLISGMKGVAGNVSISPEGKYVAYNVWGGGEASLWVRQVSQDTSVQIFSSSDEGVWLSGTTFSHDGEVVYFVKGDNLVNPLGSLYQIPVLGGKEPKKILDHVSGSISLSPDGKQIAFIRDYPESIESTVVIANIDGSGEVKKIGSRRGDYWFSGVSWSPDGKTIACAAMTGISGTLVLIPVEGGEEKPLTEQKWEVIGRLQWIKDGSGLILSVREKTTRAFQLWHLSYPHGNISRITNDLNDYTNLDITADAGTLVTTLEEWSTKIWLAAPNEDESRAIKISHGKQDGRSGFALMPDGQRIVYIARVNDHRNVWIMNTDGTGNKALTADSAGKYSLTVSPEGRYIVFGYLHPDNMPRLWRMDADGSNLKQLTTGEDYNPSFSPDGRWIVFHSLRNNRTGLWKVSIDGGEAMPVSDKIAYNPLISPDGKLISCWFYDESAKPPRFQPALISFEDGRLIKILELPTTIRNRPVWSPDGRELIYIDRRSDVDNIWSQPVAGGAAKQLTRFSFDLIDSFELSRDGKRLVIARSTINNDIVLIKDFR